jgi:hypothetical protein
MPLYPQSATSKGVCPNSLFFCRFPFRLTFESIKELGSASVNFWHNMKKLRKKKLVIIDPFFCVFLHYSTFDIQKTFIALSCILSDIN